jgi:hypothetical protein
MQISAPFAGFLSLGLFGRHERKFSRHFKRLFLRAYRRFESPLVRQQVADITREYVTDSILPLLPRVSPRSCARRPLRERILRNLHAQCRSFLRTRLCQWLFLRMMVLITANSSLAVQANRGTASDQLRMMQVFSDQQSAHHILNFFA